jgi:hypothetical protein
VTPQQTAENIAAYLRTLGLVARVHATQLSTFQVWAGNSERDEEGVFGLAEGVIHAVALKLGRTKALRERRLVVWAQVVARCDEIAARFREHAANRAEQDKAWQVADRLKALGLPAVAFAGRVRIDLDLSPEYAADVGPRIAAVMGERKV